MQFRSDHILPASAHFRPATIAIFFVLLMAFASIPIATHPLPPLSDYVNHLARTHVIDAIGTDSNLSRYYTVEADHPQPDDRSHRPDPTPVHERLPRGPNFHDPRLLIDRFRDTCI